MRKAKGNSSDFAHCTILSGCIVDSTCAAADSTKPVCDIDGGNVWVGMYVYIKCKKLTLE